MPPGQNGLNLQVARRVCDQHFFTGLVIDHVIGFVFAQLECISKLENNLMFRLHVYLATTVSHVSLPKKIDERQIIIGELDDYSLFLDSSLLLIWSVKY